MKNNLDSIQPKVCESFVPFIEKYEFGKITDIKTGKKEIQFPHMLQVHVQCGFGFCSLGSTSKCCNRSRFVI